MGHRANFCKLVPVTFSLPLTGTWNTPSTRWHSTDWTGARWLQRAAELETEEEAASKRHPSTSKKRLRLTSEILQSLGYEDLEVLELLQEGSTLADDIEASAVFQSAFKPVYPFCNSWKIAPPNAICWYWE